MKDDEAYQEPITIGLKPGEAVVIETRDGFIRVVQLSRWRLSIQAPAGVDVLRAELAPPANQAD